MVYNILDANDASHVFLGSHARVQGSPSLHQSPHVNQSYHHSLHAYGHRYDCLEPYHYWPLQQHIKHNANLVRAYLYGHYVPHNHLQEVDEGHPFTFEVMEILILTTFKPLANLE